MKIRTDFVTNSSSSSYVMAHFSGLEGYGSFRIEKEGWGGNCEVADVRAGLRDAMTPAEVADALSASMRMEGWEELPEYHEYEEFLERIRALDDVAGVGKLEVEGGIDFDDGSGEEYKMTYDFATKRGYFCTKTTEPFGGTRISYAKADIRSLDGEELPFEFGMIGSRFCLTDCRSSDRDIVIPERILEDGVERTVQGLARKCFARAKGLETLVLPRTVDYIARDALYGTKRTLRSVRFAGDNEGETAFVCDGSLLVLAVSPERELAIPDDVTDLGDWVFGGCWNLRTVVLHDGMKKPKMKALQSSPSLTYVRLTDGSKINVSKKDAMRCFTVSRGIIRFNYAKCAGLMLEAGDALEFKRAVRGGALTAEDLEGFYEKIKLKRKPEYKEMKEFILQRLEAKGARVAGGRVSRRRGQKLAGDKRDPTFVR